MLRIILAIIIGFVVWSILWVGSDAVFSIISLEWGKTSEDFRAAVENNIPYTLDSKILIILLIKSVIISIISGFVTAFIARETVDRDGADFPSIIATMVARKNIKSPLALGILLLLSGIFIQSIFWDYLPLWYHIVFLLLLIPMTILGSIFRRIYDESQVPFSRRKTLF